MNDKKTPDSRQVRRANKRKATKAALAKVLTKDQRRVVKKIKNRDIRNEVIAEVLKN